MIVVYLRGNINMIEYVVNNWDSIAAIVAAVVTVASGVASLTPTPVDDGVMRKVRKVVDVLALNVGNAKNK